MKRFYLLSELSKTFESFLKTYLGIFCHFVKLDSVYGMRLLAIMIAININAEKVERPNI